MTWPWAVPANWRWEAFQSVARVASNLVDPAGYQTLPHIAPNHIQSNTGRLLPYATVAADGVTSSKHLFRPGQVIYSKIRPYLAKAVVVDFEGLCSADMYPIESDVLDARFLKWWMLTPEFTRLASGEQARTVLPKINKHSLGLLPVPVPPLDEQRRIVDLLEDHLSRLDAADNYLAAAKRRLESLQASALADVFRGEPVTLGELAIKSDYGTSEKCMVGGPGPAVVRIPNLIGGSVELADEKRVADSAADVASSMLEPGDVLIVRTNGSVALIGRSAVVQPGVDAAFASYLIRYRLDPSRVFPEWVHAMLSAPQSRARLERLAASSAGQHNLSLGKLDGVPIPLPTLERQGSHLRRLADLGSELSRLTHASQAASRRAGHLRRSLLAAAFSGRLTGAASDVTGTQVIEELAGV